MQRHVFSSFALRFHLLLFYHRLSECTTNALIFIGYRFDWTGFNGYNQVTTAHTISGPSAGTVIRTEEYQPGKALWDWLQLLIIPVVLAVGALLFNLATTRTEQKIASDKQREDLLQAYLDRMSELLLKEKLRSSAVDAEVRNVARVRTITILFQLDARRIGYVFAFLRESGLMSTEPNGSVVNLIQADLREINLSQANLFKADLRGAILSYADLRGAILNGANLFRADLFEANLSGAFLHKTIFARANLGRANLSRTFLFGEDLSGVNLSGANLKEASLSRANLSGAILSGVNLSGADLKDANLSGAILGEANLTGADFSGADLSRATLFKADLSGADLSRASLNSATLYGATLRGAIATPEQFTGTEDVTPEQLAQIRPPKPAAPQEAKTEQASATPAPSEGKPDQPGQKKVEQQEHNQPKQGTDGVH